MPRRRHFSRARLPILLAAGTVAFAARGAEATGPARLTEEERAILCLDLKTLARLPEETATFQDMSTRMVRMETTLDEIRGLIAAMPNTQPSPAVAPVQQATAPQNDLPWEWIASGGGILAFMLLLWRWRAGGDARKQSAPPLPIAPPATRTDPTTPASAKPAPIPMAPIPMPEHDQSIELADVMISMGLAQGAADALLEQIRAHPKRALFHWLKLLEVYRNADRKDDFEKMAAELRENFNIQAQEWQMPSDARDIESYGHICKRIQELWHKPAQCIDFILRLIGDNRDGARAGFPQSVAEDLLLLLTIQREKA